MYTLKSELSKLSWYLASVEKFLDERLLDIENNRIARLKNQGFSDEDISNNDLEVALSDLLIDEMYSPFEKLVYQNTFPDFLRRSVFVTSYSMFESALDNYAHDLGRMKGLRLTPNDMNGRGITRSKTYLVKVMGIDLPETDAWRELLALNKLRNCIVHNEARIEGSQEETFLNQYIAKHANLLKTELIYVVIKKGFCEYTVKVFNELKDQILKAT